MIASDDSEFDSQVLLDELDRRLYDCLLMAQQLPNRLDAIELAGLVCESLNPAPSIILITDQLAADDRQRALAVGVAGFLDGNELTPESLRAVIDIAVKQHQS